MQINNDDALTLRIRMAEESGFAGELRGLFNKYELTRNYDAPDYVLCRYILDCLAAWENALATRHIHKVNTTMTKGTI